MEHFASTLATTAAIVLTLAGTARIVDPHDPSLEMRRSQPAVAQVATDTDPQAWSDPPARGVAASPVALVTPAQAAEVAPPAPTFTMMPWPSLDGLAREAPRRAERSRRQKVARSEVRRPAEPRSAGPSAQAEPAATRLQPATQAASNGDPIGTLLRGLGFGREG